MAMYQIVRQNLNFMQMKLKKARPFTNTSEKISPEYASFQRYFGARH
jgi:hypothetical protein